MSLNGGFMKIVVIDGQGGRIGSLVTARLCKEQLPNCELYAIGTNATATAAMLKAGADFGATGENPVLVACRDADFIIGPLGILSADSPPWQSPSDRAMPRSFCFRSTAATTTSSEPPICPYPS